MGYTLKLSAYFYKILLARQPYQYYNIISAMNSYGIDCEGLSIDEYDLMLWDIEFLCLRYSMANQLEMDAAYNLTYEGEENSNGEQIIKFPYHNYRLLDRGKYSDTFTYGVWHWFSTDLSAVGNMNQNDQTMKRIYKKLIMNLK